MKNNNPENMINLGSNRKLFIGFNREDYDHLKKVFENLHKYSKKKEVIQIPKNYRYPEYSILFDHKLVLKMPKFTIFIVLHGDMDTIDAYVWIYKLEYLIYSYDCYKQIKVIFFAFDETTKTFARLFTGNNSGNFKIQGGYENFKKNSYTNIYVYNSIDKIYIKEAIKPYPIPGEFQILYNLPSEISKDQFKELNDYRRSMFFASLEKLNKNTIYGILDDRK